jgi:hypothetical protein
MCDVARRGEVSSQCDGVYLTQRLSSAGCLSSARMYSLTVQNLGILQPIVLINKGVMATLQERRLGYHSRVGLEPGTSRFSTLRINHYAARGSAPHLSYRGVTRCAMECPMSPRGLFSSPPDARVKTFFLLVSLLGVIRVSLICSVRVSLICSVRVSLNCSVIVSLICSVRVSLVCIFLPKPHLYLSA